MAGLSISLQIKKLKSFVEKFNQDSIRQKLMNFYNRDEIS